MLRVNGLYGWVKRNDARTLLFFAVFVALTQTMAALLLLGPTVYFDAAHSLLHHPGAYALRYGLLVTLGAGAYFAYEMTRDVSAVRRDAPFRFVDTNEEPRLCNLVEPLATALGLGAPYVGVMEVAARNAFACGARRRDATLVFTRGLIDALDDDELEAVAAHELVHVKNGDTRTLAAANVLMRTLQALSKLDMSRRRKRHYFAPTVTSTQLLLQLGRASRLLISSAREYVADAEAVRLTQHPAAFVSALRRIAGRSALPQLPPAYEAMMFDGLSAGRDANHPTVEARIRALVAMTGAAALEDRPRRDTRPVRPQAAPTSPEGGVAFRRELGDLLKVAVTGEAPRQSLWRAFKRVKEPVAPPPAQARLQALGYIALLLATIFFNREGLVRMVQDVLFLH